MKKHIEDILPCGREEEIISFYSQHDVNSQTRTINRLIDIILYMDMNDSPRGGKGTICNLTGKDYETLTKEYCFNCSEDDIEICTGCKWYKNKQELEIQMNIERHIIETQKCSVSAIQRAFNLNYPKAIKYINNIKKDNCAIPDGLTNQ